MFMFTRRHVLPVLGAAAFGLAGCMGGSIGESGFGGAPTSPVSSEPLGDVMGQGQVRVGLLLPSSAGGSASQTAASMRNAAEMALREFNNPNIQLIVKDDGGTPQGAQTAAQEAISEGAEIILGPVFAQSVAAAGQVARMSGVPVIGFSTDTSVAGNGVYLLSFLPQSDVERIVSHAIQSGKRSFAALVPDTAYGTVVEASFKETVARLGGRIVAFERYDAAGLNAAAQRVASSAAQADALFLPESADAVPAAASALASAGVDLRRVQLLGTGLWDDPRLYSNASLNGGRFPGADRAGYQSFAARYRSQYGQEPLRTASLAYDAVSLVAALAQTQGLQRFSAATLTNPSGFRGVDGVFRFRSNGTIQRNLAVMEISGGSSRVVAPAPASFAAATN